MGCLIGAGQKLGEEEIESSQVQKNEKQGYRDIRIEKGNHASCKTYCGYEEKINSSDMDWKGDMSIKYYDYGKPCGHEKHIDHHEPVDRIPPEKKCCHGQ